MSFKILTIFVSGLLLMGSAEMYESWNKCSVDFGTWNMVHSSIVVFLM
jgi:hypothetical protein